MLNRDFFLGIPFLLYLFDMDFEIPKEKLQKIIQRLLDSELNNIRELSKDWGLGEMGELEVIDSVEKIQVTNITSIVGIKIYINIYSNYNRYDKSDYQDLRAELQYRVEEWFPNIELYIDEVIN